VSRPRRARRRARAHRRGFTLLETLVALATTAVLLGALATAVPAALRAREAATARLERATTVRTLLLHLEHELAGTLPEPFTLAGGAVPRLAFTGGSEPGEQLAYAFERGALVRRTAPRGAQPDPAARGIAVLEDVAAVELRAFDGTTWVEAWQASAPPVAVRIRILFTDGEAAGTIATIPTARPRRAS